jgi:hypothetical protein
MRLTELDGTFLKLDAARTGGSFTEVGDVLAGSDGVRFLCPLCFVGNKLKHGDGRYGTHGVICWWVGVPDGIDPKPGRWTPQGTGLDDLTFVPSAGRSQSVALLSGCKWHGFVSNGDAT